MVEKLRIRLSQILALFVIAILIISSSAWEDQFPVLSSVFFMVGILLVGIASLGRLWCSLYIAGYKTKKLITQGPYSISRNPLYFFSLLGAIGVGFASETLLIPFIIMIAFVLYYPSVIRCEEAKLKKNSWGSS